MIRFKIIELVLIFCVAVFIAGCSSSLDTGGESPLSTTISYQLNEETHVKLWVENAYKTTIATLVDEVQQPGLHQVNFVAVDSNGNNLPEGIYTRHIKTDSFSQSSSMFLSYP